MTIKELKLRGAVRFVLGSALGGLRFHAQNVDGVCLWTSQAFNNVMGLNLAMARCNKTFGFLPA